MHRHIDPVIMDPFCLENIALNILWKIDKHACCAVTKICIYKNSRIMAYIISTSPCSVRIVEKRLCGLDFDKSTNKPFSYIHTSWKFFSSSETQSNNEKSPWTTEGLKRPRGVGHDDLTVRKTGRKPQSPDNSHPNLICRVLYSLRVSYAFKKYNADVLCFGLQSRSFTELEETPRRGDHSWVYIWTGDL